MQNGAHSEFEAKSLHRSIIWNAPPCSPGYLASIEYNIKDCYVMLQNRSPLLLVDKTPKVVQVSKKWQGNGANPRETVMEDVEFAIGELFSSLLV